LATKETRKFGLIISPKTINVLTHHDLLNAKKMYTKCLAN